MKEIKLEVSDEVAERIRKIQARMELKSAGKVIAQALALYDLLTEEALHEGTILVRSKDGEERTVDVR